jgi:multiple antibiotic resistance protein
LSLISTFFAFNIALFIQSFVLLFSIFDPFGTVPIFMAITEEYPQQRKKIVRQSIIVATIILFVFAYVGWVIFGALGITINDFRIAGGIVLFAVAFEHLGGRKEKSSAEPSQLAVFPLATPLLAGPGAISTVIILSNPPYSPFLAFVVIVLNSFLAYVILDKSEWVQRILGVNGTRALTSITALLIAALAVSFVRQGIVNILFPS